MGKQGTFPGQPIPGAPIPFQQDTAILDGTSEYRGASALADALADASAGSHIALGPASTSYDPVTISDNEVTVEGAGSSTFIDGGTTAHALEIDADQCEVRSVMVQTTAGGGNNFDGLHITSGDSHDIANVYVQDSDRDGIRNAAGNETRFRGCHVEAADRNAYNISATGCLLTNCIADSGVSNHGFRINGLGTTVTNCGADSVGDTGFAMFIDDCMVSACLSDNAGGEGIYLLSDDMICTGCRVISAGADGIRDRGTSNTVNGCRVSGSASSDINATSATTPNHVDNVTGAAN